MKKLPEGIHRLSPATFVFTGFYAWLLEEHFVEGINIHDDCSFYQAAIIGDPGNDGSLLVINKNTSEQGDTLYAELLAHDWEAEILGTFDYEDDEGAEYKAQLLADIAECV